MKKVLVLSDYGKDCHTGFATVSRNIKRQLKNHFENELQLEFVAINHYGENYEENDGTIVVSAKLNDIKLDDFGRNLFCKVLAEDKTYDGIFIIQDLGVIQPIIQIIDSIKQKRKQNNEKIFKSLFYFPVDCKLAIPILLKDLEKFDQLVTYTSFGKEEVLNMRPELKSKLTVVPHGNNPKDFYPLPQEEKESFRREYFGEQNFEKIIVTNVNRNQPRKDLPNTIFGFIEAKEIAKRKSFKRDLFLYLHCHPQDPLGHDLRAILNQTKLIEFEDYMLLPQEYEKEMPDRKVLNRIYNASDIYLTTTLGEGWGLGYTEACATGLPIIAPYNTSLIEMSGFATRSYVLETQIPYCGMNDNIIREQTDYVEVGEKIAQVAEIIMLPDDDDNKKAHYRKIENSYRWVRSLDWENVCNRWIELFKSTF